MAEDLPRACLTFRGLPRPSKGIGPRPCKGRQRTTSSCQLLQGTRNTFPTTSKGCFQELSTAPESFDRLPTHSQTFQGLTRPSCGRTCQGQRKGMEGPSRTMAGASKLLRDSLSNPHYRSILAQGRARHNGSQPPGRTLLSTSASAALAAHSALGDSRDAIAPRPPPRAAAPATCARPRPTCPLKSERAVPGSRRRAPLGGRRQRRRPLDGAVANPVVSASV